VVVKDELLCRWAVAGGVLLGLPWAARTETSMISCDRISGPERRGARCIHPSAYVQAPGMQRA
jgi:hypothetical protein